VNFWKVILATIVIYGAGVITGGLLINRVEHSHPRNPHRMETAADSGGSNLQTNSTGLQTNNPSGSKPARLPEMLSKQFLQQLDEELHLSADEHSAIQKIITDSQNLMRKTMTDARLEIREQLTPAQRNQFDELVKRSPSRRPPGSTNAPPVLTPSKVPAATATNAPGV
jgi:hypothetical protein